MLASTSICFDLSLFELFVPLSWGGTVILAEDALQLSGMAARDEVRLINTVPSVMGEILQQEGALPQAARTINLAGERLHSRMVQRCLSGAWSGWWISTDPTEQTTYATYSRRTATGAETIGRPLANTRIYVLDAHQQLLPVGVTGELYLGGAGQARGYLERADLTAERFLPDPFSGQAGARLYRTGDLGRYLVDGRLEFMGRVDEQVKLRGYRIELGEVEAALVEYEGVEEAAVAVAGQDEPGQRRLVAYLVCGAGEQPPAASLRSFLGKKLPRYMVPSHFVLLTPSRALQMVKSTARLCLPLIETALGLHKTSSLPVRRWNPSSLKSGKTFWAWGA